MSKKNREKRRKRILAKPLPDLVKMVMDERRRFFFANLEHKNETGRN
jgi:hypothetical protein